MPVPARPAARARSDEPWLSLGPASQLLGVDPDTLRRWADDGRLPSFATPGGHRRFRRSDLARLAAPTSHRRSLADLGATPERVSRAYARSYRLRGNLRSAAALGPPDRDRLRAEGRRLVEALLAYLDGSTDEVRGRAEAEARAAVTATARSLTRAGTDVPTAVRTFVEARRPFLAELTTVGRRRALDVAAMTALYDDATALLDRLLVEFVVALQPAQSEA